MNRLNQLRHIVVPTWIVDGDRDEAIKRENTDHMAALIPGSGEGTFTASTRAHRLKIATDSRRSVSTVRRDSSLPQLSLRTHVFGVFAC
jgi:hypothetical protein